MKVETVNFTPTELIIENNFEFRKIGKICYINGYCQFSSISSSLTTNVMGILSVKSIGHIRDTIAVSDKAWGPPEGIQYVIISADTGSIEIHTNTNYTSKYLYGSYVFVCK